jgi:hypothetical protein
MMAGASVAQAADSKPDAPLSKAFTAQDAKDWIGARTLVEKEQPVVRDLVQWRYVSSSTSGATFDEINQFLTGHPNWPGRSVVAQRGEETLLSENLMATKGAAWFKTRAPRTSPGCLAWSRFQFTQGQKAEALASIRRCWLSLTLAFTDYQDWATFSSMPLPEADHLVRTDTLLWGRNVTGAREMLALLSAMSASVTFTSSPALAADPAQGPGGPILVITSGITNFAPFYSEILRTEGFNAFTVVDISAVTPATLAAHDVVLLAKMTLPAAQVAVLTDWVTAGDLPGIGAHLRF